MENEPRKTTGSHKHETQAAWRSGLFSLFADPVKLLTQPIKLPGWAAILFAVFVFFPDWHARLDFWLHVAASAGGKMGLLASAIASPYFSPALAAVGVLWILFVGEPKGVQRRHWLRYVGWSVLVVCVTTVVVTAGYGAIEFYIQREISVRDNTLQRTAAIRPVFWHMADAEKTALAFELDQIPEADRFEIKVKCLPDAGSRTFVEDVGKVFIDHKWKITANCLFSNVRPDLAGLYVGIPKELVGKKNEELPKNLRVLLGMLNRAKVTGQGLAIDDTLTGEDFSLLVGNAP